MNVGKSQQCQRPESTVPISNKRDAKVSDHAMPRAQGRATRVADAITSFFQRTMAWMSNLGRSRVIDAKINSAIRPLLNYATKGGPELTVPQCDALNRELESVLSEQDGTESKLYQIIFSSIDKITRAEKLALRLKINEFNHMSNLPSFSQRVWENLYVAVNDSLAKSIAQDADAFALGALKEVADMDGVDYLSFNTLKLTNAFLAAHLTVITPDVKSQSESDEPVTPANQMAGIAVSTDSVIRKWFSSLRPEYRAVLTDRLKNIGLDPKLRQGNASVEAKRFGAFCSHMGKVLSDTTV